jgi:crotonobetainyl-CoA:carnitine CoA-transferase CaiB-like acyl-CoA transferase
VFDGVDCCVTPVLRLEESLDNAQLRARGMINEVGGVRQFGPPVRLSGLELPPPRPAPPAAGGDSAAILGRLGLDDGEIGRLRAAGVI